MTSDETVNVLLIEDNPGDIRLIKETLTGSNQYSKFEIHACDRLSSGLEVLKQHDYHVILLDLSLPDSQGIYTVTEVNKWRDEQPIVVLTGNDDEALGLKAVRAGADDYVIKQEAGYSVLERSVRYSIERRRLLLEISESRKREQQAREFGSLDRLASNTATSATSGTYGQIPLKDYDKNLFKMFVLSYQDLLDEALKQQTYRTKNTLSENIRSLGDRLGFLKVGPRDIIDIHTEAVKRKIKDADNMPDKVQGYLDEGRIMVLELMGSLASHYRHFAFGQRSAGDRPPEEA